MFKNILDSNKKVAYILLKGKHLLAKDEYSPSWSVLKAHIFL